MAEQREEIEIPVYTEKLHFRYFVMSNRRVWSILSLILAFGGLWLVASRFSSQLSDFASLTPSAKDPNQPRLHTFDVIVEGLGDLFTRLFQSLVGDLSIPLAEISFWVLISIPALLAFVTFRRWMIWQRSRLVVDTDGVHLIEGDIVWLAAPGHVLNLSANIVNSASKSRDVLDQFLFWGCWQVSVLSNEQTGTSDEIQKVPVRDPDRLIACIGVMAGLNKLAKNPGERETHRLLAEIVENMKILRDLGEARSQSNV